MRRCKVLRVDRDVSDGNLHRFSSIGRCEWKISLGKSSQTGRHADALGTRNSVSCRCALPWVESDFEAGRPDVSFLCRQAAPPSAFMIYGGFCCQRLRLMTGSSPCFD
ncbi:hypothetical protein QQF64_006585 [Cirrhinus molitorella]|uniref:MATH domain-containing protein n=1 Tax=Cirrhinus molitorella TaxID=172907 RepID=A0ABR3M888_9TELE